MMKLYDEIKSNTVFNTSRNCKLHRCCRVDVQYSRRIKCVSIKHSVRSLPSKQVRKTSMHLFLSWLQTCSRSPGGPGCAGAAPCPGAPGEPAACAVHTVSHDPGLGWSDAGGTDLHPWVPHTGDNTLSHQHTATSSTKQSSSREQERAGRNKVGQAGRGQGRVLQDETQWDKSQWDRIPWQLHCTVPGSQSKLKCSALNLTQAVKNPLTFIKNKSQCNTI